MVCPFLLRIWYIFFAIILAPNPQCSGFSSPVVATATGRRIRQQKNTYEWRVRCEGMPTGKETMESSPPCTSQSRASIFQSKRAYSWTDRVYQLQEYKKTHGDTCVPRRFPKNPSLGNWVNRQRVMYRKFLANATPCSMTEEKVAILNQIGFCWDGRAPKSRESLQQEQDEKWWGRLEEFRNMRASDQKKISPTVDRWLKQQRWLMQQQAEFAYGMYEKKLEALNSVDPNWWKSTQQLKWEERYQELIAYKEKHGNCLVPRCYHKNKTLANWVSNCRKQYALREGGEAINMSQDRIDKLNELGFVWDRWEYEFEQKTKLGNLF